MMIPDKRDTLGDIPERFDTLLANALGQEAVKPMKRKRSTILVVAALMIALLATTALAVGLSRSSKADAVFRARQALGAKYGLTTETLGLFQYEAQKDGRDWVVAFVNAFDDNDKLGAYTVTVSPDGRAEARWSHDDVDPALWRDGDLDAPVWGQAQMLRALVEKEESWQAYLEIDWSQADFETMAQYGGKLSLIGPDDTFENFRYLVPTAEDTPVEQVRQIAAQAILDAYALDAQALASYTEETISFVEPQAGGARQYVVEYRQPYPASGWLAVQIASPLAEVLQCRWHIDNALRTLPEGPLDDYRHAVEAFMASGALAAQSAVQKADIAGRVKAAGWAELIEPALPYVMPDARDIAEDAALAMAKEALLDRYAVAEEAFVLFEANLSLLDVQGERRWTVEFHPTQFANWYLDMEEEKGKVGAYAVTLDAATGDVLEATWDQDDVWNDEGYTQSTWAAAPVYHGSLLPWFVQLMEDVAQIADRYPADTTIYDYSDADIAAYDAAFRDAGFSRHQFPHGMPGPDDLTKEEAQAIAKAALLAEMPVPQEVLNGADIQADYTVRDPEVPQWGFSFQFTYEGVFVDFGVSIDARTGVVLYTGSITGGNG